MESLQIDGGFVLASQSGVILAPGFRERLRVHEGKESNGEAAAIPVYLPHPRFLRFDFALGYVSV